MSEWTPEREARLLRDLVNGGERAADAEAQFAEAYGAEGAAQTAATMQLLGEINERVGSGPYGRAQFEQAMRMCKADPAAWPDERALRVGGPRIHAMQRMHLAKVGPLVRGLASRRAWGIDKEEPREQCCRCSTKNWGGKRPGFTTTDDTGEPLCISCYTNEEA